MRWTILGLAMSAAGCVRPPGPVSPLKPSTEPDAAPVLLQEPFESLDSARWREIDVKGRTDYAIARDENGDGYLSAHSRAGASVLLLPVRFNPDRYGWISWRWRVERFTGREDLTRKAGSDAAARVYVYFDTPGPAWKRDNLDYVWSERLPADLALPSAFSSWSKIIVAQSGPTPGVWQSVRRNLADDYRRCFGRKPPDVVAIGFMTDTDTTRTEAAAAFDDLVVSRASPAATASLPSAPTVRRP